jgi:hypothetical protein
MLRPVYIIALLLVFSPFLASAQIQDDFSDGNFTQNPAWQGLSSSFIINAQGVLQLNAPDAGTATLAVQGNIPDSAIWQMNFKLEFAPSTSNLLRIYLMADQADLINSSGYLLEIGENGNADAFRFFRSDAGVRTLLASGIAGLVGTDPVDLKLKMSRNSLGDWTLEAGLPGSALQFQFSANDNTYSGGNDRFFGVFCLFSATRKDKFFFDNISVVPDLPDTQTPVLILAQATDENHVIAFFDEALDSLSAVTPGNYTIAGVGQPLVAELLADKRSVRLSLPTALGTGAYSLQTNQIKDVAGNISPVQTIDFQYIKIEAAELFDIVINEIMADPQPLIGMPDAEWVELYNRSDKIINLSTLRFDDGATPITLPAYLLKPDSFVVLCAAGNAAVLKQFTPYVLPLGTFPSLNNDGDLLTLSDLSGQTINRVLYSIDMHDNIDKKLGGWTLERIDPETPCLGDENWQSCPVPPGGSPGAKNFSYAIMTDNEAPKVLFVYPISANSLLLTFSEGLDNNSAGQLSAFTMTPSLPISSAVLNLADRTQLTLNLGADLIPGVVYTLQVLPTLQDCSGNALESTAALQVGLPEKPGPQDIVINEVLINPSSGGARFIEVYNRSQKIFGWTDFYLANFMDGTDIEPINVQRLLFPGDYQVFTSNPLDIYTRYPIAIPKQLLFLPGPSFADDEGNVTLYWSKAGETITVDSFDYTDELHNALYSVSDREGVSLERIRTDEDTNVASNWTSGAKRPGNAAGTPTLPNSQRLGAASGEDMINLSSARISPDDDGYEDFLDINFQLPETGYAANVSIYDAEGIPVRRLVKQDLTGTSGSLRWDGELDNGTRARPGIYILFLELFNPNGEVTRIKKSFAVVKRF